MDIYGEEISLAIADIGDGDPTPEIIDAIERRKMRLVTERKDRYIGKTVEWKPWEDKRLRTMWQTAVHISVIVHALDRRQAAIQSRAIKLGLKRGGKWGGGTGGKR